MSNILRDAAAFGTVLAFTALVTLASVLFA